MELPSLPDLPDVPIGDLSLSPYLLLIFALPLLASLLRRVPVIGVLLSLASWLALGYAVLLLVQGPGRFDPTLSRITEFLQIGKQEVVGDELRITMSPDGHFWARATINGVERRMLVDSGATVTALNRDTAEAAGVRATPGPFPTLVRTANGMVRADTGTVKRLNLSGMEARDLPVLVSSAFGDVDILGMNFLSSLKSWRVEGRTLILVPKGDRIG